MADLTSIVKGKGELDVFNNVYLTLSYLVLAGLSLYGYQDGNLGLFAAGMVFIPLLMLGDFASRGRLRFSPASFPQAALGFWIGRGIVLWGGDILSFQFSFFSTPTKGYLSTAMSQASKPVQYMINGHLAPVVENSAIIGSAGMIYVLMRGMGFGKWSSLGTATAIMGYGFAKLHGAVNLWFTLLAFLVMGSMIVILIGVDSGLLAIPGIPVTFAFTGGVHSGINIGNMGGLLEYYGVLLSADKPVYYASQAIMGFEVFSVVGVLIGLWILPRVGWKIGKVVLK